MIGKLLVAMRESVTNTSAGVKALRMLLIENPGDFLRASVTLLHHEPEAPGHEQLLRLLASNDHIIEGVCDPVFLNQEESVGLASRLARVEPQVDTKLTRLLHRAHARPDCSATQASMDRILALLDAIPSSPRTAPALASLLRDPNPRLRAKLAKLVGRCVQNTRFASEKQQESDPRVRANAIESLWGDKASSASSVLWRAAKDANNRVVGNSLLGLYQLQDKHAVAAILAMSADPSPQFRASAAWVMGQTADPRFLQTLDKLSRDLYAPVRKNASRAVKMIQQAASVGSLELRVLRTEGGPCEDRSIWIQALDQEGDPVRGLLPSQFILWSGQKLLTEYEVVEHVPPPVLGVAFALCREGAESLLADCLRRKPPEHFWAIAKFYPSATGVSRAGPAALLTEPEMLRASLAKLPLRANECPFLTMLPLLYQTEASRHLVLFAGSGFAPESEPAIAAAAKRGVSIHAIVTGIPSGPLKQICERTAGMLFPVSESEPPGPVFRRMYLALSNRYCIRHPPDWGADGRIEVYSRQGRGNCDILEV